MENFNIIVGESLFNRGNAYLSKGYNVKAQADFERLLELQPTALAAHMAIADAWASSGEHEKAIVQYTKMLKSRQRLPRKVVAMLLIRRAVAFGGKKEHALAIKDYDLAITIDTSMIKRSEESY